MKAFLVSAILLAVCQISVRAQSACEINDVHTNPDPKFVRPAASAGQPPYRTNHFDWKAPPPGANYKHIEPPSDFLPRDGWELVSMERVLSNGER